YELNLPQGHFDIVYQYLGYETQVRPIEISESFLEINITLKTQVTVLQTVIVRAGNEDPAYTIMRKAIAKANYHRNQLDSYAARVYIKGAGKLTDYPWLAKRALEKEGVEKDRVYVSESVSEIKYTRPNKFEENVISIYSDGKDNNTSPNPFIYGSFYESEIGGTISPLSPKAFSYYRFEYLGTFKDREYEVSRIKVTPRSRGDNVVEGTINIVENWWSIHSLDFKTTKYGIGFLVNSVYAPIEDKVWLPISFRFTVDGKVFGFEFEYKYLASISDYKIQLNPELYVEPEQMEVVDETLEKEHAKQIEKKFDMKGDELQQRLESGKEITRKELKIMMKEYEKQELKQQDEPEVISNYSHKIDSGAYKKDSAYWAIVRPIPLTIEEIKGYHKTDSLAEIERKKDEGDTLKQSKHKGFQPWDILIGDHYQWGKHSNFQIHTPGGGFNTVDGFYLVYKLSYGVVFQDTNKTRLTITPTFRYAFNRESFSGHLLTELRSKKYQFKLDGGRYVQQYNPDNPIWPIVNTFTTLFLEKNLMKIYERDFVDLYYRRNLNPFVSVYTSWSWMKRRELFNNSDFKLINNNDIEDYTPNRPVNLESPDTGFPEHDAFTGVVGITTSPWLKFRIRNGRKEEVNTSSPTFMLEYKKGFNDLLNSDVKFGQLELGVKYGFNVGVRGKLDLAVRGGTFLNSDKMYFMDYKHFLGNLTPFSTSDPVGSFRLLDYYLHSTSDKYFSGNIHYQFRKFLVTSFPVVRLTGIRENVFLNYLATPTSKNYTELGYSIDGIFRIFRLELAAAFQDGQYLDYGVRIGIATTFQGRFTE
ncbi:MAG TPA: DUF5686 family protein, partial [Cyclobacteriaceae bacterium]|nr:DUF5686 family protein [Cyclobacteriaceae bacterium]